MTLAPAALLLAGAAAAPAPDHNASPNPERINIAEVLKPGTELLGMTLPRYDEMLRLASVVRAEKVILVEDGLLEARNIDVRFFDPASRKCLGHIHLTRGTYSQTGSGAPEKDKPFRPVIERIRSEGPAVGTIERMMVNSGGVHCTIEQPSALPGAPPEGRTEGFLFGPVTIRIAPKPPEEAKDMKSTLRQVSAATLAATTFAAQPADNAPPPTPAPPPAAEPAPASPPADGAGLRAVLEESERTTRRVKEYLEMEDLMERAATRLQRPEPVEFKAGEKDTVISCDGGAYFDVKQGVVVFMGGVVVDDPRFKASGIDKLEAFFAEKPGAKPATGDAAPDGDQPPAVKSSAKWELQRLVATGAVRFLEKKEPGQNDDQDKLPVEASGEVFTYQVNADDRPDTATLSGGRPWMRRGESAQRAKQRDQTITFTIVKEPGQGGDGDKRAVTRVDFSPGGWDTYIVTGELPQRK